MNNELTGLTATELLALYASGTVSPVDVVQACLDRIDALEPAVNAVRLLRAEDALADAVVSAERWAAGRWFEDWSSQVFAPGQ